MISGAAVVLTAGVNSWRPVRPGRDFRMIMLEPCAGFREKDVSGEGAGNTFPGSSPINWGAAGLSAPVFLTQVRRSTVCS